MSVWKQLLKPSLYAPPYQKMSLIVFTSNELVGYSIIDPALQHFEEEMKRLTARFPCPEACQFCSVWTAFVLPHLSPKGAPTNISVQIEISQPNTASCYAYLSDIRLQYVVEVPPAPAFPPSIQLKAAILVEYVEV